MEVVVWRWLYRGGWFKEVVGFFILTDVAHRHVPDVCGFNLQPPTNSCCTDVQMLYNDQSPMENHHVAASFAVLTDPRNNFLDGLSRKVSEA